jgi:ubiquitin carboxyl-terminal hydrolase 22/27/51
MSSKIDTHIKIPLTLDMTPHTTRAVKIRSMNSKNSRNRSPQKVTSQFDSVSDGIPSYKYSLFAVVCHEGSLDTGHYKSYCRVRSSWFSFDDHKVQSVDLSTVLHSNAYMLFYVRDHVEYAPGDVPDTLESASAQHPMEDIIMGN